MERFGVPTLASCLGMVELSIVNIQDVGDHDVVLCDVERYEDFASESDLPLYTAKLRELGLITWVDVVVTPLRRNIQAATPRVYTRSSHGSRAVQQYGRVPNW